MCKNVSAFRWFFTTKPQYFMYSIKCQVESGSCDLFKNYEIFVQKYMAGSYWSHVLPSKSYVANKTVNSNDLTSLFIITDSVLSVEALESSSDTFWLIKITYINCSELEESQDSYGHVVMKGHFFERVCAIKALIVSLLFHEILVIKHYQFTPKSKEWWQAWTEVARNVTKALGADYVDSYIDSADSLFMFSTGLTLFNVLLLFSESISLFFFMHSFWCYLIYNR